MPWAAKGYEASVRLSGLLCMKGHLISLDLRACRNSHRQGQRDVRIDAFKKSVCCTNNNKDNNKK